MEWWYVNFPSKKSSRCSLQYLKQWALYFEIAKGWRLRISWFPDKPPTLSTTTLRHWLSWMLKFLEWDQRGKQPLSRNTILPAPIPDWKLWSTLPILAGLAHHIHIKVWIWRFLTSICSGSWQMDCVGQHFPSNDTILAAVRQWGTSVGADFYENGMQALVHGRWKSVADDGDCVEKQCFVAENLLYQIVLLCSLYLLQFPWKWIGCITSRATYVDILCPGLATKSMEMALP